MDTILDVVKITAGYGEKNILHGVSLSVKEGEIVAIIGPNGAGKSTLLKAVFGQLFPHDGEILFRGEAITRMLPDRIVKKGISYVPQVDNVFPGLTVKENLEMGGFLLHGDLNERCEKIYELFPVLKIKRNQKAGQLSGGQRQMVAMGRALMLDPQLLLLDEPSAGLAPRFVSLIFDMIRRINSEGISVLLVEQNAREALKMSHQGYVLAMGRNVMTDTSLVLLNNPEIGKLYLGG